MGDSDKKWLSSDTFEFEEDSEGNEFAIKTEPGSLIRIIREKMPKGSFTKFIREAISKNKQI